MLLDFVVAGFSKCGTTTLCSMLMQHPHLFIPPRFKEPRFFNEKEYIWKWQRYTNFFHEASANMLLGEGTVTYSEYEFVRASLKRIKKHSPKIKIILIARDPVDRIESSYREMHNSGPDWGIDCPFEILNAMQALPNMINDSRYFEILQILQEYFPREQILMLLLEDFKAFPEKVLAKCFSFLGVDPSYASGMKHQNLNTGDDKFYDAPRLRALRNIELNEGPAKALFHIPVFIQNQIFPQLNLRIPFSKDPIDWSLEARNYLINALGNDSSMFLDELGRKMECWPRFSSFLN